MAGRVRVRVDVTQIRAYEREILRAPVKIELAATKNLQVGGKFIQGAARELIKGQMATPSTIKHYPDAITFELIPTPLGPMVEIGPDDAAPQGKMGVPIELGGHHTHPMPHLFPAFELGTPAILAAIELSMWYGLIGGAF